MVSAQTSFLIGYPASPIASFSPRWSQWHCSFPGNDTFWLHWSECLHRTAWTRCRNNLRDWCLLCSYETEQAFSAVFPLMYPERTSSQSIAESLCLFESLSQCWHFLWASWFEPTGRGSNKENEAKTMLVGRRLRKSVIFYFFFLIGNYWNDYKPIKLHKRHFIDIIKVWFRNKMSKVWSSNL